MTENAAAPAPVTEEVTPNETQSVETPTVETSAPEPSERDAMSDIYDKLNAPDDPIESDEPVVQEEPKAEETVEAEKPPSDLPGGIKTQWGNIPAEARDAITEAHREMAAKNADMGRQNQATKPVYDVLVNAAREMPELANMTPEQIGKEVFNLAKVNAQIQRDPVNTIAGFIQKFNVGPQVAQLLGGQVGDQTFMAMQQKIASLEQELSKSGNPEFLEQQFSRFSAKQQAVTEVDQFAATAEHWGEVVNDIPMYLDPARKALSESASNADVLSKAYELATFARGLAAKAQVGDEPAPQPDPKKAEQVKKATSVNLPSTASDGKRNLSEREKLSAAYDRAMNA